MMKNNKTLIILFAILGVIVLLILFLLISSFFTTSNQAPSANISPTPQINTTNPQKTNSYQFTPLQKTIIGETKENTIEDSNTIISQTVDGDTATYITQSHIKLYTNTIKTKNGVVIFETTRTEISSPPPPRLENFQSLYGNPELVMDSVSSLGRHVSAYIYATKGFTLFANRFTGTVYDVHRYLPLTLSEYQKEYAEYLQPAPPYPQEGPDDTN